MNSMFIEIMRHCNTYVYNGRWPIRLNIRQYITEHLKGHPSERELLRELSAITEEQIERQWKEINGSIENRAI